MAKVMNKELDPHLANPPTLNLATAFYLDAYHLLGTCRSVGFGGAGPIPYTAISLYCKDHEITGDDAQAFIRILMHIDAETLDLK